MPASGSLLASPLDTTNGPGSKNLSRYTVRSCTEPDGVGSTELVRLIRLLLRDLVSSVGVFPGSSSYWVCGSVLVASGGAIDSLFAVQLSCSDMRVKVLLV
jgi:hypothetical protein